MAFSGLVMSSQWKSRDKKKKDKQDSFRLLTTPYARHTLIVVENRFLAEEAIIFLFLSSTTAGTIPSHTLM